MCIRDRVSEQVPAQQRLGGFFEQHPGLPCVWDVGCVQVAYAHPADGEELIHCAALVGLDVTERDPAQPVYRHDPLDGCPDTGQHCAMAGVEQQWLVVVEQELVERESAVSDLRHKGRQPVDPGGDLIGGGGHERSFSWEQWVRNMCTTSSTSRVHRSPPGSLEICWSTSPVSRAVQTSTWRRASRQSTGAGFFNIVSNLCTMLKGRQAVAPQLTAHQTFAAYDGCQGLWLHGSWTRQLRSWRLKTSELTPPFSDTCRRQFPASAVPGFTGGFGSARG